jgi:quercetin dioxygenase-like cupin family protein
MNHARLEDMVKGWFVGKFSPTAYSTDLCEVALKSYASGEREDSHYHKQATEITLIVFGRVFMCGREWGEGDIIVLSPGEATSFEALTASRCIVVKTPGAPSDKFLLQE